MNRILFITERLIRILVIVSLILSLVPSPAVTSRVQAAAPRIEQFAPITPEQVGDNATAPITPTPTATTFELPTAPATDASTAPPQDILLPAVEPMSQLAVTTQIEATGGALTSADGRVEIAFPANAAQGRLAVDFQPLANPPADQSGFTPTLFAFEATAHIATGERAGQAVTQFTQPLDFTIDLTPLGFRPGMDGRGLWFGYFNEQTNWWQIVPFTLDIAGDVAKLKAKVDHFSYFGLSAELNPGWALLYNAPAVDKFSGAATYRHPLKLPPSPNGIAPEVALTYNNQQVSGLHGWYQSDWVGHGWSLNTMEIVRELGPATTNTGAECTNKLTLLFNGVGYTLIAANVDPNGLGRYYTQEESNLHIERVSGGMDQGTSEEAVHWYNNSIRQYWLIRDENGTVYQLGYKGVAEQIVWSGKPGSCGSGEIKELLGRDASTGAPEAVMRPYFAFRWRLDRITDVYGNVVDLHYDEARYTFCDRWSNPPSSHGLWDQFGDRSSYLQSIYYNNFAIKFERSARPDGLETDDGYGKCDKLLFQSEYLSSITVLVGAYVRQYRLDYKLYLDDERKGLNIFPDRPKGSASRELTRITEVAYDANGENPFALPSTTFEYWQFNNFKPRCIPGVNCPPPNESCGGNPDDCMNYNYWHLQWVDNGYGTKTWFYYEDDRRTAFWYKKGGYTYRVSNMHNETSIPGQNGATIVGYFQVYTYGKPCYNQFVEDPAALGKDSSGTVDGVPCPAMPPNNPSSEGRLVGHETVTEQYIVSSVEIARTVYTFEINDTRRLGRELNRKVYSPDNVLMSETTSAYATQERQAGDLKYWRTTLSSASETVGGATTATTYQYDAYGNPTEIYRQGTSAAGDEQLMQRTYIHDQANPTTKWFVGKLATEKVSAGPNQPVLAETRYFYDGQAPFAGACPVDNHGCALTTAAPTLGDKGALTAQASWIGDELWAIAQTTYDALGNVTSTTDPRQHTTTFAYTDTLFPYLPTSTTSPSANGGALTTRMTYNRHAMLTSLTDPNEQTIRYEYDQFDRLLRVYEPQNPTTFPALEYQYTDAYTGGNLAGLRVVTKVRPTSGVSTTLDSYTFYNSLGQMVQTRSPLPDGQQAVVNTVYGANNLVVDSYVASTEPFSTDFVLPADWNSRPKTHTTYDALLRPISVTVPGISAPTQTSYGPLSVTLIDANAHKTVRTLDGLGRLLKVEEFTGTSPADYTLYATTTYAYDALGNLLSVQPPVGGATTIVYDHLNRKTQMSDPAMGAWLYAYDASGNLTRQTDARGQQICLAYDALSRLTGKSYGCAATPTIQYTYDAYDPANGQYGRGRRTGMTDPSGATAWTYDSLGRMTREAHTIQVGPGVSDQSEFRYSYDLLGRVQTTTYPDGEVVTQTYNGQGLPESLTGADSYVSTAAYNTLGQMTRLNLPNHVTSSYGYDAAYRLNAISHQGITSTLASYAYTFDNVGNILSINEVLGRPPMPNALFLPAVFRAPAMAASADMGSTSVIAAPATEMATNATISSEPSTQTTPSTCGSAEPVPATSATYFTDPTPTLDRAPNEVVLRKELRGFANYGVSDQRADILYTGEAATWQFSLPSSIDPAAVQSASFRVSLVADDVYTTDLNQYALSVWTNSQAQVSRCAADVPHGAPYGTVFTNWVQKEYTATLSGTTYTVSLANHSTGSTFLAVDWIELRLVLTPPAHSTIQFQYDALDRLVRADYPAGRFLQYGYDAIGNRLSEQTNGGATSYAYDAGNRLTAFNGVAQGYDANGNMTTRVVNGVAWTQKFDEENRLAEVSSTQGTWRFTYNGDGARVKQVAPDGAVTVYVGSYEATYVNGVRTNVKKYYTFGAQTVALRDNGALSFLHGDHLGSSTLTTDRSGNIVAANAYDPFGASRLSLGVRPTALDFTGQRLDGTGLHFYNARYYDSVLGRFISADTIVPDWKNLQTLNRYAYTVNNPLKYVDPSGHCWGIASGIRGLPSYDTTCNNLDMASIIITHPGETFSQEDGARAYVLAVAYTTGEIVAHGTAIVYSGVTACGALSSACYKALTTGSGILGLVCADNDCSNEAQSVWQLNPFKRGVAIENILGRSPQLSQNFPVIDRFQNGTATSIKSIDLTSPTYQDIGVLTQKVQGYVNKLASWQGTSASGWNGVVITNQMIQQRELLLAIPPGATQAQMTALQQLQVWAPKVGVTLKITVVP